MERSRMVSTTPGRSMRRSLTGYCESATQLVQTDVGSGTTTTGTSARRATSPRRPTTIAWAPTAPAHDAAGPPAAPGPPAAAPDDDRRGADGAGRGQPRAPPALAVAVAVDAPAAGGHAALARLGEPVGQHGGRLLARLAVGRVLD